MAATSRINAYRGLRSLFYLHKPSAAKKDYSTRFPALQVFFWHFYKIFLRNFYVMPKVAFAGRFFNRVHGFRGKEPRFSSKLQCEKVIALQGPGLPGPYRHLIRQLQFIHPPAILGGDEADEAQRGCIRHNRVIPCPAREVLALTSQHDLIKCKAAVRL